MSKYVQMFTYVDIITRPGRWWIGSFIVLCWLSHTHTNTNYLYCNNDMDKRCIVVALGKKHRVDCFSAVELIVDHATMLLYADCYTDKKRHFFFALALCWHIVRHLCMHRALQFEAAAVSRHTTYERLAQFNSNQIAMQFLLPTDVEFADLQTLQWIIIVWLNVDVGQWQLVGATALQCHRLF